MRQAVAHGAEPHGRARLAELQKTANIARLRVHKARADGAHGKRRALAGRKDLRRRGPRIRRPVAHTPYAARRRVVESRAVRAGARALHHDAADLRRRQPPLFERNQIRQRQRFRRARRKAQLSRARLIRRDAQKALRKGAQRRPAARVLFDDELALPRARLPALGGKAERAQKPLLHQPQRGHAERPRLGFIVEQQSRPAAQRKERRFLPLFKAHRLFVHDAVEHRFAAVFEPCRARCKLRRKIERKGKRQAVRRRVRGPLQRQPGGRPRHQLRAVRRRKKDPHGICTSSPSCSAPMHAMCRFAFTSASIGTPEKYA